MPVTLTIKQVPDRLAQRLRTRAAANHRSLQGELIAILEAAAGPATMAAAPQAAYRVRKSKGAERDGRPLPNRKITLAELWQMGRRMGLKSRSESARIIRKARDERDGG